MNIKANGVPGGFITVMAWLGVSLFTQIVWLPPGEASFHKGIEKGAKKIEKGAKGAVEGVKDAATHPERSAQCAKGDTKVVREIAERTVKYARDKWRIADLVKSADMKRAESDMYEFLKWKLGSPTTVCGQYITAGYDHFKKAYGDEAAAALLGFDLPNEKAGRPEFFIPPELIELKNQIDRTIGAEIGSRALEAAYGIPSVVSKPLLIAIADAEAKVLKRVGFNLPKKYDISNGLVEMTIDAKRNPNKMKAKIQRAIREVPKKG